MTFHIMTLFPEMLEAFFSESIIGRAQKSGAVKVKLYNIRDYTIDKHRKVDDTPYGGGCGMVMTCQPIIDCHKAIMSEISGSVKTIYMSPQGRVFNQGIAEEFKEYDNLILLCGHYEGVDERAIEIVADEELSVGDYVLTGGELPAAIVCDSVARLCDGVLPSSECYEEESHQDGLLEYPHYTKPYEYSGKTVPDVLISGHHANITKWRREQAILRTKEKRPDLYEKYIKRDADF